MKINSKLIIFIILTFVAIILVSPKAYAALQSNGQARAGKSVDEWMLQARQMESLGGGLGLSETIDETNLTATSPSNNIDVHMQKNTEYGALVILSASSYGNPNKINDGQTTTGNSTGVVMKINGEWVSAGAGITHSTIWKNAVERYKNTYTGTYVAKRGDAILNWHGSSAYNWFNDDRVSGLLRSTGDSVFSYDGKTMVNDMWFISVGGAYYTFSFGSRACIVMGKDI